MNRPPSSLAQNFECLPFHYQDILKVNHYEYDGIYLMWCIEYMTKVEYFFYRLCYINTESYLLEWLEGVSIIGGEETINWNLSRPILSNVLAFRFERMNWKFWRILEFRDYIQKILFCHFLIFRQTFFRSSPLKVSRGFPNFTDGPSPFTKTFPHIFDYIVKVFLKRS